MIVHGFVVRAAASAAILLLVLAGGGCSDAAAGKSPSGAALDQFESELADLDAELSGEEMPAGTSDRLNRAADRFAQVSTGTRVESDATAMLNDLKQIESLLEKRANRGEIQQAVKNLQSKSAALKARL